MQPSSDAPPAPPPSQVAAPSPSTAPAAASPDPTEPALAIKVSDPALQWGPCPPIFPGDCQIAVLRVDPAAANADVFLKVAGKYKVPPHFHSSAERMVLVTGELSVT